MKIKMRVSFSGAGFTAGPGDEIERPDDEAIRLIRKGYADPLGPMPEVETAVRVPAPETRVEPFGGKGDHDGNGKIGGAKKPAPVKPRGKRR
jgi:hypothetical protein